ncbi:MAG: hypothetical protein HY922_04690 [Elusimicrobia bacterium]|nr:hypothetical protein [Elusimicrobiota bacterium]
MADDPSLKARCWGCGGALDRQDRYCRGCGRGQGEYVAWYYQPWGIAVCTLLGLGPFGLLLVWRSPRLSRTAQWAWTAAILLVTGWVLLAAYRLWVSIMSQVSEILKLGLPT